MASSPLGFVAIPFQGTYSFFYLYIQHYLRSTFNVVVERGDHRILSMPVIEKIRAQIQAADVVIGEITEHNPNVFYELELADAYDKPIILLTRAEPRDAPADVRDREFIHYSLDDPEDLLRKLNNAIQNVFIHKYQALYEKVHALLLDFNQATGSTYIPTSLAIFQQRVMSDERTQPLPDPPDDQQLANILLPKIFPDTPDTVTMKFLLEWITQRFGDPA